MHNIFSGAYKQALLLQILLMTLGNWYPNCIGQSHTVFMLLVLNSIAFLNFKL